MYRERIYKFLAERKRTYSATQIAEYFLCDKNTVRRVCRELIEQGLIRMVKFKRTNFYRGG